MTRGSLDAGMYPGRAVDHNSTRPLGRGTDGGKGKAMAAASREHPERAELTRVQRWRFEELMRAGYALPDAIELALRTDVDLHWATSLVERGCPSETAVRIAT